jgi:hypothetical protein
VKMFFFENFVGDVLRAVEINERKSVTRVIGELGVNLGGKCANVASSDGSFKSR